MENLKQIEYLRKNRKLPNAILLSGYSDNTLESFLPEHLKDLLGVDNHKNSPDCLTLDLLDAKSARELVSWLSVKSFNQARVVVIKSADKTTIAAANVLLKSLEEPQSNTFFILTTNQEQRLLATLKSRLTIFRSQTRTEPDIFLEEAEKIIRSENLRTLISQTQNHDWTDQDLQAMFENLSHNLLKQTDVSKSHRYELLMKAFEYLNSNVSPKRVYYWLCLNWHAYKL